MPEVDYQVGADLSVIPTSTGCYLFKNKLGESQKILYVGKAKNLRARVRQYFTEEGDGRAFSKFIRDRTNCIEFLVVSTEQDALVLENELIKKHRPPYNISLKDDKRFLSLRLDTQHEWPKIDIVRKVKKDRATYLGPFSSTLKLRETLNLMQKVFPLRSCPDSKLYNRARPCLEYDMKRCVAPCVGYVKPEAYRELVMKTIQFLKGENQQVLEELEKSMTEAAEREAFEEAAHFRDQIRAVQEITTSKQSIVGFKHAQRGLDFDALGVAQDETRSVICAIFVRNGIPFGQRVFEFKNFEFKKLGPELREEMLAQFLERYYSSDVYIPHEVLIAKNLSQVPDFFPTNLLVPRESEKKNFLELAEKNAEAQLKLRRDQSEKIASTLDHLQSRLGLKKRPVNMDCFDISHFQGSEVVASCVRFHEGLPDKNFYRRIRLENQRIDDFESLAEAVTRRYRKREDLPDLVVIDGGKGQLSSAHEALKKLELAGDVDLISLAKARPTERPDPLNPMNRERVFLLGQKNPVLLEENSKEELLLSFLRDEAHRFAITYHRKKDLERYSASRLDSIAGMTAKAKMKLLKEFLTIDGIVRATDFELLKIIRPKVLQALRQEFPREDDRLSEEEE